MASRGSWAKANNPFWFPHAAACYQAHWTRRTIAADVIFDATLMLWAGHPLSPEDLRKSVKNLQSLHQEAPKRQDKNGGRSGAGGRRALATACAWTAVRMLSGRSGACMPKRSTGAQHGACRVRRSARSFAASVAHMARSSRRIRRRNGLAIAAASECPGSIKQRC